jgi:alkylation response protein AidB-like acyl-CoA dehydrogenase
MDTGGSWLVTPVGSSGQFTDADFTEEDLLYARTAEEFAWREILPRIEEIEAKEEGLLPRLLRRAGELGLLMIDVPKRYGGLGLRNATSLLVAERSALCASFSISLGAHTGIGTLPILYYGSDAQKRRYLPKLATGEWLGAYALTEPQAGSDALAMRTRAVLEPGGRRYRLTGTKQFITNAGFADLFTVFGKVDGDEVTAFLVERTTPGLSLGPEEHKLGIRGSSTRQVILEDAPVPVEHVLGAVGQGHKLALNMLNIGRFKLGAGSGGIAKGCLRVALAYAAERVQFGRPIARFGMIQRKLADMAAHVYATDSMGYRTAGLLDTAAAAIDPDAPDAARRVLEHAVEEYAIECSILKVFGTEAFDFVADEALQILGGYGFTTDYPIERHYRDSRIYRIFEGTNEINRLLIATMLTRRIGQGRVPYGPLLAEVDRELASPARDARAPIGPPDTEARATESAKRVLAYTLRVLLEHDLDAREDRQQHLEILADMVIDVYAMDSVVNRTRILHDVGPREDDALRRAMTTSFVASAHPRVAAGARCVLANLADGPALHAHLARVAALARIPATKTMEAKTRIAEALAAGNLGAIVLSG